MNQRVTLDALKLLREKLAAHQNLEMSANFLGFKCLPAAGEGPSLREIIQKLADLRLDVHLHCVLCGTTYYEKDLRLGDMGPMPQDGHCAACDVRDPGEKAGKENG